MQVAVVTPTVGSEHFARCAQSVAEQTYTKLNHYVFVDGAQYNERVTPVTQTFKNVKHVYLDDNVGKGWYGHRVYAACSFLVNADAIIYLDEDNWIEPTHVQTLVDQLTAGSQWAYSLRKIVDNAGDYVCNDDCESLGKWPVYFDSSTHHIDTSAFMIPRSVAVQAGHAWYAQWGADRQFFATVARYFPNYSCTGQYTLNYRLDGNPNSVTADFFKKGNAVTARQHQTFPWRSQTVSL